MRCPTSKRYSFLAAGAHLHAFPGDWSMTVAGYVVCLNPTPTLKRFGVCVLIQMGKTAICFFCAREIVS